MRLLEIAEKGAWILSKPRCRVGNKSPLRRNVGQGELGPQPLGQWHALMTQDI